MKILGIIFAVLFIIFFFGKVSLNGKENLSLFARVGACLLGSAILTIVIGLPVLGIIHLFQ